MPSAESELKALFERGRAGDAAAYRAFLHGIGEVLRKYVKRQLYRFRRFDGDPEDIVQEALLAIHNKRFVYEPDVPVTAWAHAIARYRLIDWLRANNIGTQTVALDELDEASPNEGHGLDLLLTVRRLLGELPERLRTPLELTKLGGLSVREAAEVTATSEASVKVNVHRGLKMLARGLER